MQSDSSVNDNTRWSGFVLGIVVAMLLLVYFMRMTGGYELVEVNIDPNLIVMNRVTAATQDQSAKSYKNDDYNFEISYPVGWIYNTSTTGEGDAEIFSLSFDANNVGISVMSIEMEEIVRNSVSIISEKKVLINGVIADQIEGTNLKDGALTTLLIIKNNNRLYNISGFGDEFNTIINNFELL